MKENELSTCISGSFKFKPEIDRLIEEFQDLHIRVLAPEKGWLYIPRYRISPPKFRPLPSEKGIPIKQIEDDFLRKIKIATFLYVANIGGYLGNSANFEIGFALGNEKPVYASEKINNIENDLAYGEYLKFIKTMNPEETVKDVRSQIEKSLD